MDAAILLLLAQTPSRFDGENPVYRSVEGCPALPFEWSTSGWSRTRAKAEGAAGAKVEQRAEEDDDETEEEPEGPWELTGIASSTSIDSYETEMSIACLRDMRDQFNSKTGVVLTPSHMKREWFDVLGRSIRATLLQTDVVNPYDRTEKPYKLEVVSRINPKKELSRELAEVLGDESMAVGMSIGGWFVDYEIVWDAKKSTILRWIIHKVNLDHLALTRSPANPDCWVSKMAAARSLLLELERQRLAPPLPPPVSEKKETPALDKPALLDDASDVSGSTAARSVTSPPPSPSKEADVTPDQIRALIEQGVREALAANAAPAPAPVASPTSSTVERAMETLLALQVQRETREAQAEARREQERQEAERKAREEKEAEALRARQEAEAARQAQAMTVTLQAALAPLMTTLSSLQGEVTALKAAQTPTLSPELIRAQARASREPEEDLLRDLPPEGELTEAERLQRENEVLKAKLLKAQRSAQNHTRPGTPGFGRLAANITLDSLRESRSYHMGPSFPGEQRALTNLAERVDRAESDGATETSLGASAKALIPFLFEKPGKVDGAAMNDAFRELLASAVDAGALA